VTIKNTAASGAASLTFNLDSNSSYGSVIIDTGSGTTIAQGGNKTYTPTFTLQSVLSTTIDNAGTLKISSTDANNHANVSINSPQDINIKLVPVASIIIPPVTENQTPNLQSLENVPNTCSSNAATCQIKVTWTNPQNYTDEKIKVSPGVSPNENLNTANANVWRALDVSSEKTIQGGPYTETIGGFESNKKYGIFIRAIP